MLILGVSSSKHDTAAALFDDGIIRAAIENDKLVRSHSAGLPNAAIRFCLEQAGASWDDLDAIAVENHVFHGSELRSLFNPRSRSPFRVAPYQGADELGSFSVEMRKLHSSQSNSDAPAKIFPFDHHLCHAASAFFLSPFDRALIVTMDEEGDGNSGMIAVGEGTQIRVLRKIRFPHSLAWVYSQVTRLLGFVPHREEHKTQWMSLGGEPVFKKVFLEMFRTERNHLPHLNCDLVNPSGDPIFSSRFYREVGLSDETTRLHDDQRSALASSLQHACAEIVSSLTEHFRDRAGLANVCLAGGLFQNTLLVAMLERQGVGIDQIFVPPAPGNAGCALGAGLLVWHTKLQKPRLPAVTQVYGGPSSRPSEIKDVLDNCKTRYSMQLTSERKIDATLQLLESGKIVGWFQGPTEFGPRALGNRSLLASPWASYVRENLNDYIKHREWFRPFALAVCEEDSARYFECSQLCQSMNSLAWARPEARELLDGFVLPGNLVRLHVVRQKSNPHFWQLIKCFGERAPGPFLINTSFNLFGEPLVVKPRDAVRSYFCSGVDALMIDMFLLSKSAVNRPAAPARASEIAHRADSTASPAIGQSN